MSEGWTTVDPLGEALHLLRMSGTFYSRCEFSAPWALDLPPFANCLMFHVVTTGRCWLEVSGAADLPLQAGDLALVPHGDGHRLASEPGLPGVGLFESPREELSDRYEIIRMGGGGAAVNVVCGAVRFDHPAARHLVGMLPRVIAVEASEAPDLDWMRSTLRLMAAEAKALRPGGEAVITRLADVLVIQAIRAWIDRDPTARTGWLGALRDPQIGRAIGMIHRDPSRAWSVARLADEVAMSRSAFAARFSALVGEPPMQYLARWRMHLALDRLVNDGLGLGEVAAELGYQSEAAFSRAFKRITGHSPGVMRRLGATA